MVGKQMTEATGCDAVDEVPPGPSDDELLEHGQRVWCEPFSIARQRDKLYSGVAFFAIFSFAPDREHRVMPGVRVVDGVGFIYGFCRASQQRHCYAKIRHG